MAEHLIEVYDKNGNMQVVDEPVDVVQVFKLVSNPADDYDYKYSNATVKRYVYLTAGLDLGSEKYLVAEQPDTSLANAEIRPKPIRGYTNRVYERARPVFHYFTWLPQAPTTTDKFGLEVFNADGDLTWASYLNSLSILDVLSENDFRNAANPDDYFIKNYGHKNVAVIPIHLPLYQVNRNVFSVYWYFTATGALKIFRGLEIILSNEEISYGVNLTTGYKFLALVVDVRNS